MITDIVVAFDVGSPKRRELFAGYKADNKARRDTEDPALARNRLDATLRLRDVILPDCGIMTVWREGYEADDIIASLSSTTRGEITILSSDEDLWQLVSDRVQVGKIEDEGRFKIRATWRSMQQEFGVTPKQWPMVLAIAGGHDGIPGVKGCGKKYAIEYVRGEASDRVIDKVEACKELALFLKLVKLPYPGTDQLFFSVKRPGDFELWRLDREIRRLRGE